MTINPKAWMNSPETSTPLSAAALIDMETRMGAYADSVAAGGTELGYAQITADFDSTTTWDGTVSGFADVTGLSITITADGVRPIMLEVFVPSLCNLTANKYAALAIKESGTLIFGGGLHISATAGVGVPACEKFRVTPSAGSHTYNVGLARFDGTGTARIDVTAASAAYISAVRV